MCVNEELCKFSNASFGVPVSGEQKAAVGEGEGLENGERGAEGLLATSGNACNACWSFGE